VLDHWNQRTRIPIRFRWYASQGGRFGEGASKQARAACSMEVVLAIRVAVQLGVGGAERRRPG
jgi:hypothetical protein